MTRLARTMPALLFGALLAIPAAAQYEPPGGGDPDPPQNCAGAANKVQVTGAATTFSPSTITIDPGQAVCWTWSASMSHNVVANDGSFSSGQPTTDGSFQKTFTQPGTYGYYCQVHGSATAGMRGTVVVRDNGGGGGEEPPPPGPGTLSLDPGAYEVDENAGTVTLTITRTGGSVGKVKVKVASAGGSATKGKDFLPKTKTLTFANGDANPQTFTVPIKNDRLTENDESFSVVLTKPTGRAVIGNSSALVTIHDDESAAAALLAPSGVEAAGVSGREIRLAWAAEAPEVKAVRIERRSGDGDFVEVAAVAAGAGEYVDGELPSGTTFHYRLRADAESDLSEYTDVVAAATDGAIGPCAAAARTLCLGGGRFEAKATFRRADGEPLQAALRSAVPAASRSGLLGLGSADDPQLMLKVVDGCVENDHFWVELAAVTDLELEVSVRDTQTGRTWAFYNPAGKAAGVVRDLDAFGTCP